MLLLGEPFSISSVDSTVSGVGDWKPSRAIREPVTTTSAPVSSVAGASGTVVACVFCTVAVPVCAAAGAASAVASVARLHMPANAAENRC